MIAPFLFTTVMDDLTPVHDNTQLIKFADDVTYLHFIRKESDDVLDQEFLAIKTWAASVGLNLNCSKTKILDIKTSSSLALRPLVDPDTGNAVKSVDSAKLLGLTYSGDFSWRAHIREVEARCNRRLLLIRTLHRLGCPD